jgi:hypothetical protein
MPPVAAMRHRKTAVIAMVPQHSNEPVTRRPCGIEHHCIALNTAT